MGAADDAARGRCPRGPHLLPGLQPLDPFLGRPHRLRPRGRVRGPDRRGRPTEPKNDALPLALLPRHHDHRCNPGRLAGFLHRGYRRALRDGGLRPGAPPKVRRVGADRHLFLLGRVAAVHRGGHGRLHRLLHPGEGTAVLVGLRHRARRSPLSGLGGRIAAGHPLGGAPDYGLRRGRGRRQLPLPALGQPLAQRRRPLRLVRQGPGLLPGRGRPGARVHLLGGRQGGHPLRPAGLARWRGRCAPGGRAGLPGAGGLAAGGAGGDRFLAGRRPDGGGALGYADYRQRVLQRAAGDLGGLGESAGEPPLHGQVESFRPGRGDAGRSAPGHRDRYGAARPPVRGDFPG